jgi:hypothetical protein
MKRIKDDQFVPATRRIEIGEGVGYRPLRSWHSGVLAGEEGVAGELSKDKDRSGLTVTIKHHGYSTRMCYPPKSVTHRFYWKDDVTLGVSCFLSYPNGMGAGDSYFWEVLLDAGDVERFKTEEKVEARILEYFRKKARN